MRHSQALLLATLCAGAMSIVACSAAESSVGTPGQPHRSGSNTGTGSGAGTGAAHAKLTGSAWTGLIIASGGTLALDGVDVDNAATAINTQSGNAGAKLDNGSIHAPTTPFKVDPGSKLSMTHSAVVGAK